eukprot:10183250-Heterocapsa_arctica.AAC.1
MGYSWISHYKKEQDLQDFTELANYLDNGMMQRMATADTEEEECTDGQEASSSDENKQKVVTKEMMKDIASMVAANMMTEMKKIKEQMGGLEQTHA